MARNVGQIACEEGFALLAHFLEQPEGRNVSELTKRERVQAALRGKPVDRVPAGFWWHDFLREWSAEGLAEAMLEQTWTYDFDYLKVNPRATYYAEAWGCTYRPSGDRAKPPDVEHWVLQSAAELDQIGPVDPRSGPFAEQLEALRLIGEGLGGDVPFVQTVFSPLAVLVTLANRDRARVRAWMTEAPDALRRALGAIAGTLAGYAKACLEARADGIFFPTVEWATYDALGWPEYEMFARPYDLQVLEAVQGAEANILHVCRPNNMLERLLDYPVAAVNWAVHAEGNLSLAEVLARTDKAVMGGIDERRTLIEGSPADVRSQAEEALRQTGGNRFLLAPGCSISPLTPPENLRAAFEAVRVPA
jgi:uroporphyrinogen decarboxylase